MAMTLRTDPELDAALDALSTTLRISKQEVLRRAVLELEERSSLETRVADSSARMREKWGDVLDRLGSV